ncbi:hypothetical protein F5Y05DRAFT_98621 [Hypoxylon sp. FL0543]|nr:hypothetical protein F5Y05DRAFT_98621 [Hypoxylon sp. FL0543]
MSSSSTGGSSQYTAGSGYSYTGSANSDYTVATYYSRASDGYYNQLPNPTPGALALPCEFVGLGSCDMSFNYDETEAWIEHIITDHLQNRLPNKAVCWFCDTYLFDAKAPEVRDRRLNFHNRMEHIREHLAEGKTVHDIRPDFHMLDHLRQHQLISEAMYNQARRWHESLLRPEHMRHVYRPRYVPPERQRQQERENMVPVDQSKEERRRRRDKAKGGRH